MSLQRRAVVKQILTGRGDALVIAGLGGTTWDVAAAGDDPRNFYVWGAMGGAAMIGEDGSLQGIGSLFIQEARAGGSQLEGNMIVPIDLLPPILDDLVRFGRVDRPPRPWLGLYSEDLNGRVFVNRVASYGPAAKAGIAANSVIVAVGGEPVRDMADFYRKLWALGPAGVDVPLTLMTPEGVQETTVRSADRYDFLKIRSSY